MAITEGIVSNLAAKAVELAAKAACAKVSSWWVARDDLKKLEVTIKFIQARIRDAECRQEEDDSGLIKLWLHTLKLLLYRADDLFDEVLTVDLQNQQDHNIEKTKLGGKVGILFSKSSVIPRLSFNRKLANEIKSIKKDLDAVKSNMDGLNLRANFVEPFNKIREKQRETAYFVKSEDVIGREDDKKMIIDMLFDPIHDGQKITVIPIVGVGGLGKTTLAQLVFNDEDVQKHFDITKWVCVPEVDNQNLILRRVYHSFTDDKDFGTLLLNQIKSGIYQSINKKKYLLVLDDIWDDSRNNWLDLLALLDCGEAESRVIVTTRSTKVAKVIGTTKPHNLGLLTEDESCSLFRKFAFEPGQEKSSPILARIGKEIVDSCGNVPLAIRVVGSLLYSNDSEEVWENIRNAQLTKAKLTQNDNIMHVLKLSYDYLPPALKHCFAYCSVFPKGHRYNKAGLVQLWMAQGYVDSSNIGEKYFTELMERSLFQDLCGGYNTGDVVMCSMHDLVHDLAQFIAGEECKHVGDSGTIQINDGLLHVSVDVSVYEWEAPQSRKMRSLQLLSGYNCSIKASSLEWILKCRSLRALHLSGLRINMIPDSIGKLIHLRYLNLACTPIECLPDVLTRLLNLQTLILFECIKLKELPRDFTKLTNLRYLLISRHESVLTDLPPGFEKMTSLQELDRFPVGERNGIDSLPALNLKGSIDIVIYKWRSDAVLEAERANLKSNHHLTFLKLEFRIEEKAATPDEMDNMLMGLQLPPSLKNIQVYFYPGYEMPSRWFDGLSKLVSIHIEDCTNCRVLPHLSRLPHLKTLYIQSLHSLEYIEDEDDICAGGVDGYFPSLEFLELLELRELKRWTRPSKDDSKEGQLLFPCLLDLKVHSCLKLMSMPLAPKLESLFAIDINEKIIKPYLMLVDQDEAPSSSLVASLKKLKIDSVNRIFSLPISSRLCNLQMLAISDLDQLTSLAFESPNSIRTLYISSCKKLRKLSVGNLPALEKLHISNHYLEEGNDGMTIMGWEVLRSLRSLTLGNINDLKKLPQGIAYLTMLKKLHIISFPNLTELPEEMDINFSLLCELKIRNCPKLTSLPPSLLGLTSLQRLWIIDCPELKKRYKKPIAEDCHLIQHIPDVIL